MATQNILNGKNKTYTNDIVKFHKRGIESKNGKSFIPFASITRVHLGDLPSTITKKTIIGILIAIVGLILIFTGKWWGILLGIIAIIGGIFTVFNSVQRWYALNIDMASGAVYSFVANEKEYINDGYGFLLERINKLKEGGTYNFFNGKFIHSPIGDGATANNDKNVEL